MVLTWIWTGLVVISVFCAVMTGNGQALSSAAMRGAQTGVSLAISITGSLCLWAGVGKLMEAAGITGVISRVLSPVMHRIFPSTRRDSALAGNLSANICANLLGLGNAATPPGISAAKRLASDAGGVATDELCRLVVLNTASIQLIPANVAAVRSALGCKSPFDILPAVWLTSFCSAGLGLTAAWMFGRLGGHD